VDSELRCQNDCEQHNRDQPPFHFCVDYADLDSRHFARSILANTVTNYIAQAYNDYNNYVSWSLCFVWVFTYLLLLLLLFFN
jgi:peptidoglycan/LPS O-acetylase OafA/YrhL